MSFNYKLFQLLNAPENMPAVFIDFVAFLANSPLITAPGLVVLLWVFGAKSARGALISASLGVLLGQAINVAVGSLIDDPRPFMVPIGNTLISHAADNGFPSDHTTLVLTLALSLIFSELNKQLGVVLLLYGLAVGWARIWLGIHFPLDIAGSMGVALVCGTVAWAIRPVVDKTLVPVLGYAYECTFERAVGYFGLRRDR